MAGADRGLPNGVSAAVKVSSVMILICTMPTRRMSNPLVVQVVRFGRSQTKSQYKLSGRGAF